MVNGQKTKSGGIEFLPRSLVGGGAIVVMKLANCSVWPVQDLGPVEFQVCYWS